MSTGGCDRSVVSVGEGGIEFCDIGDEDEAGEVG